jgi:hypothetical protein
MTNQDPAVGRPRRSPPFEAGLSSSGNVYVLERRSGGWRVVGDTMRWIS